MYCSHCGKKVGEDMLFCPFCGKPIVIPEQDDAPET
ncbi:MAG: zinc-ribbon domain-containing protein, partial [Eubacteriales bacterium]